ncbi:YchJ family protein [Onishia niordana]|uniref:YchJ family protein n=1 Tax=Onishia niordana TaxID=2508711 RepID=UPI0027B91D7A|nr:YchJ family metal-binding protein [Halomonas niordiana]
MRSRFTAFVLHQEDYLRWTWHPDTCPVEMGLADATDWKRLEVLDDGQQQGEGERPLSGWVHFRATFKERGRWQCLEEVSNFTLLNGRWVYVDGDAQVMSLKPGRNDACPCGSGRKLKKCCAQ